MKKKKDFIYLDNNATTRIAPEVLDVINAAFLKGPLNPSSQHSFGQNAKRELLSARESIAQKLHVPPNSIIFLGSATEGINQLFATFATGLIISTKVEHAALYERTRSYQHTMYVPVATDGSLDMEKIERAILPQTSALFFSYANSETGTIFPVEHLALLAKKYNLPLIIDAVAAFGKIPFSIPDGVTAMVFSGHKIHGPAGVAFMYLRPGTKITPLIKGGGQEKGLRSGTESIPLLMGLAKAVTLISDQQIIQMQQLRHSFEQKLLEKFPEILILGGKDRVANVSCIAFPKIDAESLLIRLDMLGVAASHGSACSAGAMEPSRVLLEMGNELPIVKSAIRFSLSRYTTEEELARAITLITIAVEEQKTLCY